MARPGHGYHWNDALAICQNAQPTLIYLAIGCSQAWYAPGTESPQQYPPFVAQHRGRKVCLLVDPELEDPLRIGTQPHTVFVPLRQSWSWDNRSAILPTLYVLLRRQSAELIVLDFTGTDILPFAAQIPHDLRGHVLFDPTYAGGNCCPDLAAIQILRNPDGSFLHPLWSPLIALEQAPAQIRDTVIRHRVQSLTALTKLWRIETGRSEPVAWCTPAAVAYDRGCFEQAYGRTDLKELCAAALGDLARAAHTELSDPAQILEDSHHMSTVLDVLRIAATNPCPE
jgi:hypothetical protein